MPQHVDIITDQQINDTVPFCLFHLEDITQLRFPSVLFQIISEVKARFSQQPPAVQTLPPHITDKLDMSVSCLKWKHWRESYPPVTMVTSWSFAAMSTISVWKLLIIYIRGRNCANVQLLLFVKCQVYKVTGIGTSVHGICLISS